MSDDQPRWPDGTPFPGYRFTPGNQADENALHLARSIEQESWRGAFGTDRQGHLVYVRPDDR